MVKPKWIMGSWVGFRGTSLVWRTLLNFWLSDFHIGEETQEVFDCGIPPPLLSRAIHQKRVCKIRIKTHCNSQATRHGPVACGLKGHVATSLQNRRSKKKAHPPKSQPLKWPSIVLQEALPICFLCMPIEGTVMRNAT